MKKILTLIAAVGIIISASTTVVACGLPLRMQKEAPPPVVSSLSTLETFVVDFDQEESLYSNVYQKVDSLIKTELSQPKAKVGDDYQISKTGYDQMGRPTSPHIITVSASSTSEYLTGQFKIVVQRDLNKYFPLPSEENGSKWIRNGSIDQSENLKTEVLNQIKVLASTAKEGTDYQVVNGENGSWTIQSLATQPSGLPPLIKLFYDFKTSKQDISKVDIGNGNSVFVNYDFETLKAEIHKELSKLNPNIVLGIDYQIEDGGFGTSVGDRKIFVTTTGSKHLSGSFTIDVKKVDLLGIKDIIKDNQFSVLSSIEDQKTKIFETINHLEGLTNLGAVEGIDYEVSEIKDPLTYQLKTKIIAKPGSKLVKGSSEFSLAKFNLENFEFITDNIVGEVDANKLSENYLEQINNYFKKQVLNPIRTVERTDFKITSKSELSREWIVSASSESYLLTNEKTFTLGAYDLKNIEGKTVTVGDNYQATIDELVAKIIGRVGPVKLGETINDQDGDYYIDDNNSKKFQEFGTVRIIAIKKPEISRPLITGEIEIKVNKLSISGNNIFGDNKKELELNELATIDQTITNALSKKFASPIIVDRSDFEIIQIISGEEPKAIDLQKNWASGEFRIHASSTSKILVDDSASFKVGTIDISQQLTAVEVDFDRVQTKANMIKSVEDRLAGYKLKEGPFGDYQISEINQSDNSATGFENKVSETLEFAAIDKPGKLFTGKITLNVRKKTINSVKINSDLQVIDRTEISDNLLIFENKVLNKIQSTIFGSNPDNKLQLTLSDFEIVNETTNEKLTKDSQAGTYIVRAIKNSKLITGEFKFAIATTDISTLQNNIAGFDRLSVLDDPITTANVLQTTLNDLAKMNLVVNQHYTITNSEANPITDPKLDPLSVAGTIRISAIKNNGYITGSFSFEITKWNFNNLIDTDFTTFSILDSWDAITTNINQGIAKKLQGLTSRDELINIKQEDDYSVTSIQETGKNGKITLQANQNSKYFTGQKDLLFTKFDLATLQFPSYDLGTQSTNVTQLINKTINDRFANAWWKPQIDQDYRIVGLGADKESFLTATTLKVEAINGAVGLINSSNVVINPLKDNGTAKSGFLDMSSSSYLLREKESWFYVDATYFDGDNDRSTGTVWQGAQLASTNGNPIKQNEILGISKNFLVTTRGVWFASRLLPGTNSLNLTLSDIIYVSDIMVITTKGNWQITNTSDRTKYASWGFDQIAGLAPNLEKDQYLSINDEMIVNTQGVWLINKTNQDRVVTIKQAQLSSEFSLDDFTDGKFLMANKKFFITKTGIWTPNPQIENAFKKIYDKPIGSVSDIEELTTNYVQIHGIGVINSNGAIESINSEDDIIFKNENYLMTTTKLFYQGIEIETGNWTLDDLLAKNETYVVLKNQPIYYQGKKLINSLVANFTDASEIFALTTNLIATNKGILFRDSANDSDSFISKQGLKEENFYGMSNRFVAIKSGTWQLNLYDGDSMVAMTAYNRNWGGDLNRHGTNQQPTNNSLSGTVESLTSKYDVKAITDYFLLTKNGGWTYNLSDKRIAQLKMYGPPNATYAAYYPRFSSTENPDTVIKLSGKNLLTDYQGFYIMDMVYYGGDFRGGGWTASKANYWKKEEILIVYPNGKIYTTTIVWFTWNAIENNFKYN